MGKYINLSGSKFGRLTAIKSTSENKITYWECKCECGNTIRCRAQHLRSGSTNSCGCLRREITGRKNRTHEMTKTRLYRTWIGIIQRCTNPKRERFKNYGGRGITVYKAWRKFETFAKWAMASGYQDHLTIERVNVDNNYCPSNCTWIKMVDQAKNKRKWNSNED